MIDDLEQQLGAAARAARIAAGLTRADLAEQANLSLGAVANLETGAGANARTLLRVARVLGRDGALIAALQPVQAFSPIALADANHPRPARPRQRVRRASPRGS